MRPPVKSSFLRTKLQHSTLGLSIALCFGLTACAVGPDYQRPEVTIPATWKTDAQWQVSQPRDTELKGAWWTVFGDAQLNTLEEQALVQNNTLAIAQARLEQARAQTSVASSALLPRIGAQAGTSRFATSSARPLSNYAVTNSSVVQNDFNAALSVSYELDLFGRVRRTLEGAQASEAQSRSDLENTRLLVAAQLATSYFALREMDDEIALYQSTIAAQKMAFDYVNTRHNAGAASGLDVAQQQALLSGTEAQLRSLQDQRNRFENAIATLTGVPANGFKLAKQSQTTTIPELPLARPADLLERRPDVASAERAMAAANAQIGVAKSAYFPSLSLSGLYGNDSNALPLLFSGPALLWSLGLNMTQTLFDNGRIAAGVNAAKAGYQNTLANYRQTVLVALQEVQDTLSTQRALNEAAQSLRQAVESARTGYKLSNARYHAGLANHLEVIVAQQTLLGYERQLTQNKGQQLLNSVQLIKALGGGWQP